MREPFRFSHSTSAMITYSYKSVFFRKTKRTKHNILALHIHTLVLKTDLSTLITPISQTLSIKAWKSPHEGNKIHSTLPIFTFMEEHTGSITKTLPAPNVADSLQFKRQFIKGMAFLYSFDPHDPLTYDVQASHFN
ncbi:hypothetical protein [Bartonella grahamii]|uniref:hypothetical protein n=1 Tax=Bartonella grahamii TaxID=33045 RepID=UPI001ABAB3D1|nr:hypothetical protein [Bartonella grahamii]